MNGAILVIGPESSGTRLMTRLLLHHGFAGDRDHVQKWDKTQPQVHVPGQENIVYRQSLPHGLHPDGSDRWPDVESIIRKFEVGGYDRLLMLVMGRNYEAMVASQLAAPHVQDVEEAYQNIERAEEICRPRYGIHFIRSSYEDLVLNTEQAMYPICQLFEIEYKPGFAVTNQNNKHFLKMNI